MRGLPIIIAAPSGCGKGTVIPLVIKELERAVYSVSCTTRSPRAGEEDGSDYFFITREEFEERIARGEMLEYNEYVGNLYGTPLYETQERLGSGLDVIFEVDVNGAENIRRRLEGAVSVMILPPSFGVLRKRLEGRGTDSPEVIEKRLKKALDEIERLPSFDYYVINRDGMPDRCARDILGIITAERRRTSRNSDLTNKFKNGESLITREER